MGKVILLIGIFLHDLAIDVGALCLPAGCRRR